MPTVRVISKKPKFNRIYRLIIGAPPNQVIIEDLGNNPYARRVSFNITSVLQSFTQGATIQIYNMSIEEVKRTTQVKSPIIFQAGYREVHGDNPPVIYSGNIQYPNSQRVGTDIVTTLTCHSFRDSLKIPFSLSFEQGTPVSTVLQAIQGEIKDDEGNFVPIQIIGAEDLGNIIDDFNSGSMNKQQALDMLALNHNFNWWCDTVTKQFIIVPVGRAIRENEILLVNSNTGLQKSPEINADGITFESMLEPDIRYMNLIQVEYTNSDSTFLIGTNINKIRDVSSAIIKAVKVSHQGDTRGNDWKTSCQGIWYSSGVDTRGILG